VEFCNVQWWQRLATIVRLYTFFYLFYSFRGSLAKALKEVYPELDPSKFSKKRRGFWSDLENRVAFINELEAKLNIQYNI
jgi:hypothetical protein